MKFDIGLIVVVASMIFFYIRLIQLRGRRRKERKEMELERINNSRRRRPGEAAPPPIGDRPMIQIASWWLVAGGAIIMLAGLSLRTSPGLLPVLEPYWWIVTAVGVIVFTFSLK
jgi:hypothetical protein